jgi:hypothetical protein
MRRKPWMTRAHNALIRDERSEQRETDQQREHQENPTNRLPPVRGARHVQNKGWSFVSQIQPPPIISRPVPRTIANDTSATPRNAEVLSASDFAPAMATMPRMIVMKLRKMFK